MIPIRTTKFPIIGYRVSINLHECILEVNQVELIGYNETSQSWKFRYIKNIWNSRQIEITQTTDILEDSDLDKFCLDLYSVKLKLEKFKKKFHDNLENEFGIHQNELTRLTIELNEHVEKGNYLYKNLHQITDIKIPEVASLYEKIKQQ